MKQFVGILFFTFSLNLFAIEANIFKDNFPEFQSYQQILFSQLRNYFEALPASSLISSDSKGTRTYKILNKTKTDYITLYSKISREIKGNQITERVAYFLEGGNALVYEVKKEGVKSTTSEDNDLLAFNFKKSIHDDFYQITLPALKLQLNHIRQTNGDKQFFLLGFMGFNLQVESTFKEHEATLNYIYFSKGMPDPQASLTIRAIESPSEWNEIKYFYISSQAGELGPGQFFQGLNQGASIFTESANLLLISLKSIGFPSLD